MIRSTRSTTQLSNCGFDAANCNCQLPPLTTPGYLWLPATCHLPLNRQIFVSSCGNDSTTFAAVSQSCRNCNSKQIFIFQTLLHSCFFLCYSFVVGNSTKHKHIITTVAQCPANTCCRFLISPGSAFPVFLIPSAHFNDNFLLQFSFSSVSVFDNRLLS